MGGRHVAQQGAREATLLTSAPLILSQPADVAVKAGFNALFTVVATNGGNLPMSYQWYFNQSTPVGDSSSTVLVTNVGPAQLGGYSVVVSNDFGAVTSRVAILFTPVPFLLTQPADLAIKPGFNAVFTVVA